MLQRQGHVPTSEASRYLERLCFHFTRKISVTYDANAGHALFPWGECRLKAEPSALHFICLADNEELLARVQFAIDSHIELFSRKNPMVVQWSAVCPSTGHAPPVEAEGPGSQNPKVSSPTVPEQAQ